MKDNTATPWPFRRLEESNELAQQFISNYEDGLCGLPEACTPVNDASRALLAKCHSIAPRNTWTVKINPWGDEPSIRPSNGFCYNFGADYVIQGYDEQLEALLKAWRNPEGGWTAAKAYSLLDGVYARLQELNAVALHWS